jgi:hypothetical protein
MLASEDFENVLELLENGTSDIVEFLEQHSVSVVVCDRCGRYYISKGLDSNEYDVLVPERS